MCNHREQKCSNGGVGAGVPHGEGPSPLNFRRSDICKKVTPTDTVRKTKVSLQKESKGQV